MGYFEIFKQAAQSKQSPNRRKFAQSGHPALGTLSSQFVGERFLAASAKRSTFKQI
jgi:hypothetical protein